MDSLDINAAVPRELGDPDPPVILKLCPSSQSAYAWHIETKQRHLFAVGCRRWTCSVCGAIKRRRLVQQIVRARPNRFITLTCKHEGSIESQHKRMVKALPRLITELRSQMPAGIEYLRMLEWCKDGYPHFHLLVRSRYIDQRELSALWNRLTDAKIVDIRKAHGGSTGYVAKYITKARTRDGAFVRQNISVSKQFWVERDTVESEWLSWDWNKLPIRETAEDISTHWALDRVAHGVYAIVDRYPGAEIPVEMFWEEQSCTTPTTNDNTTDELLTTTA